MKIVSPNFLSNSHNQTITIKKVNNKKVNTYKKPDNITFTGINSIKPLHRLTANLIYEAQVEFSQKVYCFINKITRKFFLTGNFDIKKAKKYCESNKAKLISPIKIFSKKEKKEVEGFLVIRKINPNIDYEKLELSSYTNLITNLSIQEKIKRTNKNDLPLSYKSLGVTKDHIQVNKNSCVIEVLDNYGISVGIHFLDINKKEIISKGVTNYERKNYGKIGTILNDTKSLIAELNGSKKVTMPTTYRSRSFHEKCGYEVDESKGKGSMGKWVYLPEKNLDKIVKQYKDTEMYKGLSKALQELSFIKAD